jgi:hypothetical protein
LEEALTEEQICALNGRIGEFEASNYEVREKIVKDFLRRFQRANPKGVEFDDSVTITVRALSAGLICSHTFSSLFGSTFMEKQNQ